MFDSAEIFNFASSSVLSAYALVNRLGGIKQTVKEKFPKIGEAYIACSPTIEHFVFGYVFTSVAFGFDSFNQTTDKVISNGEHYGGFAIKMDFAWETMQNLVRKKFMPAQFLGTCAGVATSFAINNPQKIYSFLEKIVK